MSPEMQALLGFMVLNEPENWKEPYATKLGVMVDTEEGRRKTIEWTPDQVAERYAEILVQVWKDRRAHGGDPLDSESLFGILETMSWGAGSYDSAERDERIEEICDQAQQRWFDEDPTAREWLESEGWRPRPKEEPHG